MGCFGKIGVAPNSNTIAVEQGTVKKKKHLPIKQCENSNGIWMSKLELKIMKNFCQPNSCQQFRTN